MTDNIVGGWDKYFNPDKPDEQRRIDALEREVAELKLALQVFVDTAITAGEIPSLHEWRKLADKLKPKE